MQIKHFLFVSIVIMSIFVSVVSAQTYTATIKIFGADKEGRGVKGNVTVEIQPGKGRILVDTKPLQGIYTQDSERTAVKVAKDVTNFDFSNYDVIYTISTDDVTNVEGPSAGGAMTIATIAAIQGKTISPAFSMTGTIEEDHSIGKVGEILAKAKAAASDGVTVFLIPEGQRIQTQYIRNVKTPAPGWRIETIEPVPVDIIKYAKENWGMNIYEVRNIEEALKYAFQNIPTSENKILQNLEISLPSSFVSPLKSYLEFEFFAKAAISRAENNYQKTKSKLSTTLLPDDVAIELNLLLKKSEELLDEANELIKNGFKYSAGNNGFKSSIYSQTIVDLSNYYSTSTNTRNLVLNNKLNQLKGDLLAAKNYVERKTINYMCDINNLEWSTIALQRITYAENRINEIIIDDYGNAFFDMNVANEWINIAKQFADKLPSTEKNVSCASFEPKARNIIDEAENIINKAESLGIEVNDAKSYLNAAKTEYERGWYIASLFDAASAKARASISINYGNADLEELYKNFNKTMFIPTNLISVLFYEHSIYTMHLAIRENSREDALEALQILQTGKDTEEVYKYVYNTLSGFPSFTVQERNTGILLNQITIVVLISLLVFLVIYSINLRHKIKEMESSKNNIKIKKIEKEIKNNIEKDLKKRLKKKEISKQQYQKLRKKISKITISE